MCDFSPMEELAESQSAEVVSVTRPFNQQVAIENIRRGIRYERETENWKKEDRIRCYGVEHDLLDTLDVVNGNLPKPEVPADGIRKLDWFIRQAEDNPKKFMDLIKCLLIKRVEKNVTVTPLIDEDALDQVLARRMEKMKSGKAIDVNRSDE